MALLKVRETPEEMQKDFEELDFYQQVESLPMHLVHTYNRC